MRKRGLSRVDGINRKKAGLKWFDGINGIFKKKTLIIGCGNTC